MPLYRARALSGFGQRRRTERQRFPLKCALLDGVVVVVVAAVVVLLEQNRSDLVTQRRSPINLLVDFAGNGASLKFHDVSRQSTRLVGKYIINHSQFFVQITGSSHSRGVRLGVIHFNVHIDERCLNESHDFEGNLERYGYEIVEENNKGEKIERETFQRLLWKKEGRKKKHAINWVGNFQSKNEMFEE